LIFRNGVGEAGRQGLNADSAASATDGLKDKAVKIADAAATAAQREAATKS
jgi:hypothetical protein